MKPLRRDIEQALWQRWLAGDQDAFNRLWAGVAPKVRGYLGKIAHRYWPQAVEGDFDEVLSDVVHDLLIKLPDPGRGGRFSTVCCGFARICFVRVRRSRRNRRVVPIDMLDPPDPRPPAPIEDPHVLHEAIMALSSQHREVLCMTLGLEFGADGLVSKVEMETNEIAARLGRPEDWVRRNYHKAKEHLTRRLASYLDISIDTHGVKGGSR